MTKPDLSVLLPVYNQENKLEENVRALDRYLQTKDWKYEIIICNDGSTDKSLQIAEKIACSIEPVKVTGYALNRGRGHAIKFADRVLSGEFVIYLDTDLPCTIDLNYVETMMQYLQRFDIVVASRFHVDAQIKRKWRRRFTSVCYRNLVRIVLRNFKISDPDVGFKGFRRQTFSAVIKHTNLDGWSWDLQALVSAFALGYSLGEFPFNWEEEYESTTVNFITDSLTELAGLIYIKFQSIYVSLKWAPRQAKNEVDELRNDDIVE